MTVVDGSLESTRPVRRPLYRTRLFPLWAPWPLTTLIVGFPLFWAMGLAAFAAPIMAVPMAMELRRRRPIQLPRGFGFWLMFLAWSFAGVLVLGVDPPGTLPGSVSGRLIGYGTRELSYVAVTVILLYIGNLSERELPQKKLVRLLGLFFCYVVAGGVLGMVLPNFEFTSLFELVLPHSIRSNLYVQHLVHPAAAQVQDLLSDSTPRPAAPFAYTNAWGFHLTILAAWFFVGWFFDSGMARKLSAVAIIGVGIVTLTYSLNRAAWVGAMAAVVYVAIRLAARGRLVPLAAVGLAVTMSVGLFLATPLHDVVDARLANGKSDSIRSFTTQRAVELSSKSPVVGYGSTRAAYGSASSIVVGKTRECPQCGNIAIGINGYFYLLLMSTGFVGTFLFFGLGAVQTWRARRNPTPFAIAGSLVVLMTGFYGFFYDVSTWMLVPFISLAVLWREDRSRHSPSTHQNGRFT